MYHKYTIGPDDHFIIEEYPEIASELSLLYLGIKGLPKNNRHDIIISFFKDHRIHNAWIAANPELTKVITSTKYQTHNIESLFESCKRVKTFLAGFENYIRCVDTNEVEARK